MAGLLYDSGRYHIPTFKGDDGVAVQINGGDVVEICILEDVVHFVATKAAFVEVNAF